MRIEKKYHDIALKSLTDIEETIQKEDKHLSERDKTLLKQEEQSEAQKIIDKYDDKHKGYKKVINNDKMKQFEMTAEEAQKAACISAAISMFILKMTYMAGSFLKVTLY